MLEVPEDKNCTTALLRPREVAAILNVSQSEISRLVKTNALPYYQLRTSTRKVKGKVVPVVHARFERSDVMAFLQSKRVEVK